MTIKTLKPLDFGNRRVLTTEEALAQLEGYVPEKTPQNPPTDPDPEPNGNLEGSVEISGDYILMPKANTKALGIHALRESCEKESSSAHPQFVRTDGSKIYRPLTFKEDIEARVNDYESNKDTDTRDNAKNRLRLFNRWIDSCTGVAYKAGTTKFKLIPQCEPLIEIAKDFNSAFMVIDYDSIAGVELNSSSGKYNERLTKAEVIEHPAWRAAVEDDKKLLETYAEIVFTEYAQQYPDRDASKLMRFWVTSNTAQDQLRALFVNILNNISDANGDNDLDINGSFLQVAPPKTP